MDQQVWNTATKQTEENSTEEKMKSIISDAKTVNGEIHLKPSSSEEDDGPTHLDRNDYTYTKQTKKLCTNDGNSDLDECEKFSCLKINVNNYSDTYTPETEFHACYKKQPKSSTSTEQLGNESFHIKKDESFNVKLTQEDNKVGYKGGLENLMEKKEKVYLSENIPDKTLVTGRILAEYVQFNGKAPCGVDKVSMTLFEKERNLQTFSKALETSKIAQKIEINIQEDGLKNNEVISINESQNKRRIVCEKLDHNYVKEQNTQQWQLICGNDMSPPELFSDQKKGNSGNILSQQLTSEVIRPVVLQTELSLSRSNSLSNIKLGQESDDKSVGFKEVNNNLKETQIIKDLSIQPQYQIMPSVIKHEQNLNKTFTENESQRVMKNTSVEKKQQNEKQIATVMRISSDERKEEIQTSDGMKTCKDQQLLKIAKEVISIKRKKEIQQNTSEMMNVTLDEGNQKKEQQPTIASNFIPDEINKKIEQQSTPAMKATSYEIYQETEQQPTVSMNFIPDEINQEKEQRLLLAMNFVPDQIKQEKEQQSTAVMNATSYEIYQEKEQQPAVAMNGIPEQIKQEKQQQPAVAMNVIPEQIKQEKQQQSTVSMNVIPDEIKQEKEQRLLLEMNFVPDEKKQEKEQQETVVMNVIPDQIKQEKEQQSTAVTNATPDEIKQVKEQRPTIAMNVIREEIKQEKEQQPTVVMNVAPDETNQEREQQSLVIVNVTPDQITQEKQHQSRVAANVIPDEINQEKEQQSTLIMNFVPDGKKQEKEQQQTIVTNVIPDQINQEKEQQSTAVMNAIPNEIKQEKKQHSTVAMKGILDEINQEKEQQSTVTDNVIPEENKQEKKQQATVVMKATTNEINQEKEKQLSVVMSIVPDEIKEEKEQESTMVINVTPGEIKQEKVQRPTAADNDIAEQNKQEKEHKSTVVMNATTDEINQEKKQQLSVVMNVVPDEIKQEKEQEPTMVIIVTPGEIKEEKEQQPTVVMKDVAEVEQEKQVATAIEACSDETNQENEQKTSLVKDITLVETRQEKGMPKTLFKIMPDEEKHLKVGRATKVIKQDLEKRLSEREETLNREKKYFIRDSKPENCELAKGGKGIVSVKIQTKEELPTSDILINSSKLILNKEELSTTIKSATLLSLKSKESEFATGETHSETKATVIKRKVEKDEEPRETDSCFETKLGKFVLDITGNKDVSVEIEPQHVDLPIKVIGGNCDKSKSEKDELLISHTNNIFENMKTENFKSTNSESKVFDIETMLDKNVVISKEVIQLDTKLATGVEQKNEKNAPVVFQFISNSDRVCKLSDAEIVPHNKLPHSSKLAEFMHSLEETEHNTICVANSSEEKNAIDGVCDTQQDLESNEITGREMPVTTTDMNTTGETKTSQLQVTKYEIVTPKVNGILISEEENFKPKVIDKFKSPLTKRKHEETKNVHEAYRTKINQIENGRISQTHFNGEIKEHREEIPQSVIPKNSHPFVSGARVSDTTVLPLTSATLQEGTQLIIKEKLLKDITHYSMAAKETNTNKNGSIRDLFPKTTFLDYSKSTPRTKFSTHLGDSENFKNENTEAIDTRTNTTVTVNNKYEKVAYKKGNDKIPTTMFERYQEKEQVVSPQKIREFSKLKEESMEELRSESCQEIYVPLESKLRRNISSYDQNDKISKKPKTQHTRNDEAFHSEAIVPQEKQVNYRKIIIGREEEETKENEFEATCTGRKNGKDVDEIVAIKMEEKPSLTRQILSSENNLPMEEKEGDEYNKNNGDQSVSTAGAKGKTGNLVNPKHENEITTENNQRKDKEEKSMKALELKSYLSHCEELKANISEADISQLDLIKDNRSEPQDKTPPDEPLLYQKGGKGKNIMSNEHGVGESTTSLSKEEITENKLQIVKAVKKELVLAGPTVEDENKTFDKEHPITEEGKGLKKETKSNIEKYEVKLEENQPSNVTDLNNVVPSRGYNIEYKISKGNLVASKTDKTFQEELITEPTPFNVLDFVPDVGVEESTEVHLKEKSSLLLLTEDVYISIKPLETETVLTNFKTMNKQTEQSRERSYKPRREDKPKSVTDKEDVPRLVIKETKSGKKHEDVSELESEITIPKLNEEEEETIQNTTGRARGVSFNEMLSVSSTKGCKFKIPIKSRWSGTTSKTFYKKDVPTLPADPTVNTTTSPVKITSDSPERMPLKNGILSPNKVPARLPPIKAPVGQTPKPNLKNVKSKIDSLTNIKYKPTGGEKKQLFTKKLDWIAAPKVGSLENTGYKPGGGTKKIIYQKLEWKGEPKVGTKNIGYTPGGGQIKHDDHENPASVIESRKLEWKQASSKVCSMDNVKYKPGGGQVKIKSHKLNYKDKVLSKVGSLSSSEKTSSQGSETKSPIPSSSPQPDEQPPLPPVDEPQGDEQPKEITEAGEQEADVTEQEPETAEGPEPEAEETAPEPEETEEPAPEEATEEPTVEEKEEEEATEEAQTEITEEDAPEATEEAPPQTEEEVTPETTEEAAPETTEEATPEAVEETAPDVTEEAAPEATEEEPAPEATEEEPAPEATEEEPAPEATEEETAPEATEAEPAPEATEEEPAPETA